MYTLYRRRLFVNRFNLVMSLGTMGFGMFFLLWILGVLFWQGFTALSPTLFTQMTPPPGSAGGLANAIFGSVVIVGVATFISTPIGILAGIYLAEFGKDFQEFASGAFVVKHHRATSVVSTFAKVT